MIYLDTASTTQPVKEVVDEMVKYLTKEYGNPGTIYSLGRHALAAIEKARTQVANLIEADSDDIVFTSGGTEANNMMIRIIGENISGFLKNENCDDKLNIMVSSIEHISINNGLNQLKNRDKINVIFIPTLSDGSIDLDFIKDNIDECDAVIVMAANNETGIMNDIGEIVKIRNKSHNNTGRYCWIGTDCVQLAGCKKISVNEWGVDFLTLSSHKLYGPKGVGAIYIRDKNVYVPPIPVVYGGEYQEGGWRGGTENVPAIVGFGKACEIINNVLNNENLPYKNQYFLFLDTFFSAINKYSLKDKIKVNGDSDKSCYKTVSITVNGVDSETLVLMLSACFDVCISSGSACHSNESEPSYVLKSMGLSDNEARNTIRVSFNKHLSEKEIICGASAIADAIAMTQNIKIS